MKIIASVLSIASVFAFVAVSGCAGTDASVDQNTDQGVEGLKKACGGIADIKCPKSYACVITATYPDAMGKCKKVKACVETQLCTLQSHWDSSSCACVPNFCVDNIMCTLGSHWDATQCACVEDVTCETLECKAGYHCSAAKCIKN